MNNNYRLQVRHHSEMFDSRESAFEYICGTFKYDSLVGEPAIFLYGDKNTKNPNVMLAFGAGDKKFALIDIANVEEKVEVLENVTALTQQDLEETTNVLMSAIESCGLKYDSNKITNKVSFEPDIKDVVLREAKTITEALAMLSQYTQEHVKDKNLTTKDTKSVTLSYVPLTDGMELSAVVNISVYGDSDEDDFNNNIIGVKDDGLYATSNLEYDPDKHTLTFTSSGMKNGRFQDDAKKKIIELGEHSIYTESNEGHNIELKISKIDASHSTISADVKISEDTNNIFTTQDGKLFVDGRASNIKYNKTTVADELKSQSEKLVDLSNELQEVIDSSVIKGVATDSVVVEATKGLSNEGYVIKSNVRLSDDNSIVVANGGLSANISVKVDTHNNKLFLNVGSNVIEQDLPGVNLIDNIIYDQTAASIVITFDNGKVATIPVDDLLNDYTFNNINGQPVVVETSNNTDGSINVATRLNLRSTDNILSVDNGLLYAPKSVIDDAVAVETQRAETVEAQLQANIDKEVVRATGVEKELDALIKANTQSITVLNEKVAVSEERLNILNGGVEVKGSVQQTVKHASDDILKDAQTYTDTVANTKANIGDVYTKSEIEAKGYLTEHQDVSNLATKESVFTKEEIISAYVTKENADAIYSTINTVEQLNTKLDNIDLQYNAARNVLVFNDGNNIVEYALSGHTALVEGKYENGFIILTVQTQDGNTNQIKFSVESLVANMYTDVEVDAKFAELDTKYSTIESVLELENVVNTKANTNDVYTKTQIDDKKFLVKEDVLDFIKKEEVEKNYIAINKAVANKANNLIYLDGATGGLYASNQSADMYTKWVHLGQTSILTVEEAIGLLKTNIDAINFTGVNEDITSVRNSVTVLEKAFNDYKTTVNSQLASILERVSALELKNITIESEISGLKSVDTTMNNNISTLENTTSELGDRTTTLESKVNALKNTDPDVATALSVLTGQGKDVFTDDKQTLSEEILTEKPLSVDMGEY